MSMLIAGLLISSCSTDKNLVHNPVELNQAIVNAQPGDEIVMANGRWENLELLFKARGTEAQPIVLRAEEKGKVLITGQSNLRLAGEYLKVEGLVFVEGFSPTGEVIAFRENKTELCNHCRVTECVIDNFNPAERFESDLWVTIYGRNNRFDHNHLTGKKNQGVTVAVRMDTEESRENDHRIDHNYFGPRPILGSNGGETLRIGTSHYSLSDSRTIVEYNYFDRCNGEHEIISNKSGKNTFRYNVFYECQGTLTMRHGNGTLVEENFFFGNGKPNTGGIRVINEEQTVRNNYCEGLTGYRFRGALVIMNGVPNSPLNRYFQVIDSDVSNNTVINCDYIQLCAGSDEERSAVPENTSFTRNLFFHEDKNDIFTVYDDISGITFRDNLLSMGLEKPQTAGFEQVEMTLEEGENGLKVVNYGGSDAEVGANISVAPISKDSVGVSWYEKSGATAQHHGNQINVSAGENTLLDAIAKAEPGDHLVLTDTTTYSVTKVALIDKPLSIIAAAELRRKPLITFGRSSLFQLENGSSLELAGLKISGSESPDQPGNSVIRTSRYAMTDNYSLVLQDCDFEDLDINHSFSFLKIASHTFADSIVVNNCKFMDVTGAVFALDKEPEDLGIYNVENVTITNSTFVRVGGPVLDLYRGGGDESTFGPILTMSGCVLDSVGLDKRNRESASIALHGVQYADINNCDFSQSAPIKLFLTVGEPVTHISDCSFIGTPTIQDNDEPYQTHNLKFQ